MVLRYTQPAVEADDHSEASLDQHHAEAPPPTQSDEHVADFPQEQVAGPTQAPPTQVPPTQVPPTQAPPTQAPPTQTPPTQTPPTQELPTQERRTRTSTSNETTAADYDPLSNNPFLNDEQDDGEGPVMRMGNMVIR